ncbi:MAG: heme-binding protein [Acetobacteraceae bacterium]
MALTLEEANRVIHGALAKARELNIRVSIAVCDTGGRLIAFQRMDYSILASLFASQGKAITSATVGRPSSDAPDNPTLASIVAAAGGILVAGKGGIPLLRDGIVEGACGVAGATWDQDEICARAGAEQF